MNELKILTINLYTFLKRNKTLCIIFLLSVFVILKFSNFPILWFIPDFVRNIILKPQGNSIEYKFFELSYSFSLAYISSFLFYIIVDYIPKFKKEKIAFKIVHKYFESLNIDLEELIYIFLLNIDVYEECTILKESDLHKLEKTTLNRERIYFKKITPNLERNNYTFDFYDLNEDVRQSVISIRENIENVKTSLVVSDLSNELVRLVSNIDNNDFLNQAIQFVTEGNIYKSSVPITRANFTLNFFNLIKLYRYLNNQILNKKVSLRFPLLVEELKEYIILIQQNQPYLDEYNEFTFKKAYIGNKRIK